MIVGIVGSVYARGLRAPIRHRRGASPPGLRPPSTSVLCDQYVSELCSGRAARTSRSALLHVDRRVEFCEYLNTTDHIPHFRKLGLQQSK